jgi:hypothetical protein
MNFALLLEVLGIAAAAADAAAKSKAVYQKLREAAQQSHELTDTESAELDAKAEAIFSGPASQPSGR